MGKETPGWGDTTRPERIVGCCSPSNGGVVRGGAPDMMHGRDALYNIGYDQDWERGAVDCFGCVHPLFLVYCGRMCKCVNVLLHMVWGFLMCKFMCN